MRCPALPALALLLSLSLTGWCLAAPPAAPGPDKAAASPGGKIVSPTPSPVDLNQAKIEELAALPGVGPSKARAIFQYRAQNGPFKSAEDLLKVKGIGPSLLKRIRPVLIVR